VYAEDNFKAPCPTTNCIVSQMDTPPSREIAHAIIGKTMRAGSFRKNIITDMVIKTSRIDIS
jgi:hypothetical protein